MELQPQVSMTNAEVADHVRAGVPDAITDVRDEYGTFTLYVTTEKLVEVVRFLRDDKYMAYDMFDSSFGIDEREAGFSQVIVLYSTTRRHRILLRTMADGGREKPVLPSITSVYEGADWMERETYDMFGVDFADHPSVEPRILSVENFEGWPLRKDFFLASRAAKPWPGVKEPAETDEDGNVIEKEPRIGDAPGPMPLDELMAQQAIAANPQIHAVPEAESSDELVEGATDEAPDTKQTPASEDPTPEAPEVPEAGQEGDA